MARRIHFARLALAVSVAAASTGAAALDADADGTWTGTVKCDAKVQDGVPTHIKPASNVTLWVEGNGGLVCNRFGGLAPGGLEGNAMVYTGAYIPDAPGANKGLLGFGTSPAVQDDFWLHSIPYLETGQLKLEKKDELTVKLNGKSIVLSASPGGAVTAACEFKFVKYADTIVPPPFPYPDCGPI